MIRKLIYTDTHKECSACYEILLYKYFHKDISNKYGLAYYCKDCANEKARNFHQEFGKTIETKSKAKHRYNIRKYGITLDEYKLKLQKQQNKCAICALNLKAGTWTHLDHNHKTNKLRDFLCTNCNRGLGHFKDNPILLKQAARYLENHNDCIN